eukprot:UN08170
MPTAQAPPPPPPSTQQASAQQQAPIRDPTLTLLQESDFSPSNNNTNNVTHSRKGLPKLP